MTSTIYQLGRIFLVAFGVIALALGYWGLFRRDELLARQDNPRLLLTEQSIQRGQILDRNGVVLAETHMDPNSGLGTRYYPEPAVASVVGYYSVQHGVGGIEAAYNNILRGDAYITPPQQFADQLLHRPQSGGGVRLTIDLSVQQAAEHLLAGKKGAVIVVMVPQGDILAMSSQPSFDPNQLDDLWDVLKNDPDAPLLSRAIQSLYQPGIILGTAINTGVTTLEKEWHGDPAVQLGNTSLPCAKSFASIANLQDALLWACPRPFQDLGWQLGPHTLDNALQDFGLLESPALELPTASMPSIDEVPQSNLALLSIGQSSLTVSTLQMALVAAAFADDGQMPAPRLVQATHAPDEQWMPSPLLGTPRGTISRGSAELIAQLMGKAVTSGAAKAAQQTDAIVRGNVGLALSGPKASFNSWFIGFVYRKNGDAVTVAVLLEDTDSVDDAAYIGGEILRVATRRLR